MVKIERLPSGSYRARVHLGNGKYKSITGKDKKDVQLRAAQVEAGLKCDTEREDMTLGQAMDKYILSKNNILSPSTIRGYGIIRRSRLQKIMDVPLKKLTQELIQQEFNREAAEVSPKTCRNAHCLLSATLAVYAPDMHLKTTLPARQKSEISVPTEAEIKQLVEYFRGTDMELPFMLAAFCGLRESEIVGLKWERVNLEVGRIYIKSAVVRGTGGKQAEKSTKTIAGDRSIRIFPFIREVIERTERTSENVTLLSGPTMYKRLIRALSTLGLPHYRFHDLRHYCVSAMLALNIPKTYIIDFIGHADENMIDRVYGHIMASKKTDVEDIMEEYFEKSVMKSDTITLAASN